LNSACDKGKPGTPAKIAAQLFSAAGSSSGPHHASHVQQAFIPLSCQQCPIQVAAIGLSLNLAIANGVTYQATSSYTGGPQQGKKMTEKSARCQG
jgi:hypothetical protein